IAYSGAAHVAVNVGTNGQVLSADSSETSGLKWIDAPTSGLSLSDFVFGEVPTGTINGSNVTFTLANTVEPGTERVYLDGVRMKEGSGNDYTIAGDEITFESGQIPQTGQTLL